MLPTIKSSTVQQSNSPTVQQSNSPTSLPRFQGGDNIPDVPYLNEMLGTDMVGEIRTGASISSLFTVIVRDEIDVDNLRAALEKTPLALKFDFSQVIKSSFIAHGIDVKEKNTFTAPLVNVVGNGKFYQFTSAGEDNLSHGRKIKISAEKMISQENSRKALVFSNELTEKEKKAGNTLLHRIRFNRAIHALKRMRDKGTFFNTQPSLDLLKTSLGNTLSLLSKRNISDTENGFLHNFYNKKLYVVHASDNNPENESGDLILYSRKNLIEKGIVFDYTHSPENEDLEQLANDDYVFFSLEVGEKPQKPTSRFGKTFYKVDYNHPAFKDSAMVLVDQCICKTESAAKIDNISNEAKNSLKQRNLGKPKDIMYQGRDLSVISLAHAILKMVRSLPNEKDWLAILNVRTDDEVNKVINSLFRPEIRVPRMVGIKKEHVIKYGENGKALCSSTG